MRKPDQDPFPELPPLSEDERRLRILEGLADADAGRLIPHEEVVRWAREQSNIPDLSPEAIEMIRDANGQVACNGIPARQKLVVRLAGICASDIAG